MKLLKVNQRPDWIPRGVIHQSAPSTLHVPNGEFTSEDGSAHVVEYTRVGSRGKERELALFLRADFVEGDEQGAFGGLSPCFAEASRRWIATKPATKPGPYVFEPCRGRRHSVCARVIAGQDRSRDIVCGCPCHRPEEETQG